MDTETMLLTLQLLILILGIWGGLYGVVTIFVLAFDQEEVDQ